MLTMTLRADHTSSDDMWGIQTSVTIPISVQSASNVSSSFKIIGKRQTSPFESCALRIGSGGSLAEYWYCQQVKYHVRLSNSLVSRLLKYKPPYRILQLGATGGNSISRLLRSNTIIKQSQFLRINTGQRLEAPNFDSSCARRRVHLVFLVMLASRACVQD